MTKDEFIAMVRKVGITVRLSINYDTNGSWEFEGEGEDLERFAALVAEIIRADEREACAKLCDASTSIVNDYTVACNECAWAIRERGKT